MNKVAALVFGTLTVLPFDSSAILIRTDYDTFGTTNYQRYTNLANQARFDTVGNIQLFEAAISQGPFAITNSCTGTLISANIVMTAAHCFDGGPSNVSSFTFNSSLSAMPIKGGQQVFFAGGSNLAVGGNYTTRSVDYALQFDRLSINPSYRLKSNNDISYGADIALLRVSGAPWFGTAPTNYLGINAGFSEAVPSPKFGITVGYGRVGNGTGLTSPNVALEKRAGLTVIDFDFLHPNTLRSTFRSPGTFASLLLPSNFLQAAPGSGDSGGPLVINDGGTDVIVGVVQGGGNAYRDQNWWTRVSSYSDWIVSEAGVLGSAPIAPIAGLTLSNPLLPQSIRDLSSTIREKSFTFLGGVFGRPVFLDPDFSPTVDLYIDDGPDIAAIFLPAGFGSAEVWFLDLAGEFMPSHLTLLSEHWLRLDSPVDALRLVGLDGGGGALTLGFEFSDSGIVSLRWQSVSAVPEPETMVLFILGLVALRVIVRRSRLR